MVTNMLLKKITKLVSTMLMFVFLSSMKCTRNDAPTVDFRIKNKTNESIRIEYVGHQFGHLNFTLPFTDNFSNEPCFIKDIYSTNWNTESELEEVNNINLNEAMQILENNIDSVKIIRVQDGKSILYCHSKNAPVHERFFFTQEAWTTENENYNQSGNLISRDYIFVVTDKLFE